MNGQSNTTGSMSGTVKDSVGTPLPGVTVESVDERTAIRRVVITNSTGRWKMVSLEVGGPYTLMAQLEGFETQSRKNLEVRLGDDTRVDFDLQPSSVRET